MAVSDTRSETSDATPARTALAFGLKTQILAVIVFGVALSFVWDGATRWPEAWVIPLEGWLTDFINWLKKDAAIFGVAFQDITRAFGLVLKEPVNWADYALVRGSRTLGIDQLPWVAVAAGTTLIAHRIGGWRLAIFALATCLYLAFFNLWKDSMRTMTIVLVAVPLSAALGLGLGVWVTRSKRAAKVFTPMFDFMQATPHLAYLPVLGC